MNINKKILKLHLSRRLEGPESGFLERGKPPGTKDRLRDTIVNLHYSPGKFGFLWMN